MKNFKIHRKKTIKRGLKFFKSPKESVAKNGKLATFHMDENKKEVCKVYPIALQFLENYIELQYLILTT